MIVVAVYREILSLQERRETVLTATNYSRLLQLPIQREPSIAETTSLSFFV
jgi:hypothetical protein